MATLGYDDPLDRVFRQMDTALGGSRRRSPAYAPLPEEEAQSLMDSLLNKSVGGLQWIGETLDKSLGGRAVRGLLGGRPEEALSLIPFSDTLGITDPKNAVSGRDLLDQYGITEQNRDGFHPIDDPMDAIGDVGGFLAEIALDPGAWLTGGASAYTRAGRALKDAGLLTDDVIKAGVRGRVGNTVGDIVNKLDDVRRTQATDALAETAQRTGATMEQLLADKVGGHFGVGLPFMEPFAVLGKGQTGAKVAEAIGGAMDWLRSAKIPGTEFSPGQWARAMFRPEAMGVVNPELDPFARQLYQDSQDIVRNVRSDIAQDITKRADVGLMNNQGSDYLSNAIELGGGLPPDATLEQFKAINDIASKHKARFSDLRDMLESVGRKVNTYGDEAGNDYLPRYAVDETPSLGTLKRDVEKMDWQGGKNTLRQIYMDADIVNATSIDDAIKVLQDKYGGLYWGKDQSPETLREIYGTLANSVRKATPEQRAVGLFGNDVLADIQTHEAAARIMASRDNTILDALAKLSGDWNRAEFPKTIGGVSIKGDEKLTTVGDVITRLGMTNEVRDGVGALPNLMKRLGIETADDVTKNRVLNRVIPERLANDLVKMGKGFDAPEAVSKMLGAFDMMTNLFKIGVLSWPARVVRDFMSGQIMSAITGNSSASSIAAAGKLISGQVVEEATKIPKVAKILAERGVANTPENATKVLRELAYADQMFSAQQGIGGTGALSGAAGHASTGRSTELASEMPGAVPLSLKSVFTAGDSWNPTRIRAISQAPTRFKPMAVFEELNRGSDGMNRLVPYIENLQRGVDPKEAAKIVNAIQVNYKPEAFTQVERKVLKRIFPFYSFQRKMTEEIIKQLTSRPGGGIAQALRLSNKARNGGEFLPDYVGESAAIPTGNPGQYITSLGLMHESPFEMFAMTPTLEGTIRRNAQKLGGQMSPYLKLPVELTTGINLLTGRPQAELYQFPFSGETGIGRVANTILGDSPLSRGVQTIRKLTDERKSPAVKATSLLTGIGITDVSDPEKMREFSARRAAEEVARQAYPKIRFYSEPYVPQDQREKLTEQDAKLIRLLKGNLAKKRSEAVKKKRAEKQAAERAAG